MSSFKSQGDPPVLLAVVILHRDHDEIGDGAPNDGVVVVVGPPHLPPAHHALAWLVAHGYAIRLEYFTSAAEAMAAHPGASIDIGDHVRAEGAVILTRNPSILSSFGSPRTKGDASSGSPPPYSLLGPEAPPASVLSHAYWSGRFDWEFSHSGWFGWDWLWGKWWGCWVGPCRGWDWSISPFPPHVITERSRDYSLTSVGPSWCHPPTSDWCFFPSSWCGCPLQ